MKRILLIGLAVCLPALAAAEEVSVREAMLQTQKDIQAAVQELNRLRDKQGDEKIRLGRELSALEQEILPLRSQAESFKALAWQKETGYQDVQEETAALRQEVGFCASMLLEYQREMTARMPAAERQAAAQPIAEMARGWTPEQPETVLAQADALLRFVGSHGRRMLGGAVFPGKALDGNGVLNDGQFVHLGPFQLFMDQGQHHAGQVGAQIDTQHPALLRTLPVEMVADLIAGREAMVPMDVTAGEAMKIAGQKKSWFTTLRSGGAVMVPILLLGALCLVTAVWKLISLNKLRLEADGPLAEIIALVNRKQATLAREKALGLGMPLGPVLAEGVDHARAPREQLEEIMHERILGQIPFLEKYLSLLAVAAAVAPLLGLLGTVTGMVHTFDLVAIFGTGKVNILSGGISEALVTTEYGLIVAIPTLLVHAFLTRRVKRVVHILERSTLVFINGLKHTR